VRGRRGGHGDRHRERRAAPTDTGAALASALSRQSDPNAISVTNTGDEAITPKRLITLNKPRQNAPFARGEPPGPGKSISDDEDAAPAGEATTLAGGRGSRLGDRLASPWLATNAPLPGDRAARCAAGAGTIL
jgi:hypothetical protein